MTDLLSEAVETQRQRQEAHGIRAYVCVVAAAIARLEPDLAAEFHALMDNEEIQHETVLALLRKHAGYQSKQQKHVSLHRRKRCRCYDAE